jgi:hypothetical protein
MNLDSSEARFFTLPDIFYIEKRFDFLDELRRGYIYPTIESLNLGYKANILSFDFRILDLRGMFSNYLSEYIGLYGKAQVVFSSFKLAIYGSYRTKTYNSSDNLINTNFLGVNVSLTPNNLFSIYLETRTKDIVSWPIYLETVLGVRLIETDGYSATLENYYSTGDIYKVFIEGEKKNVFGWDSWDANVAFLYSPSEFNNFKTFFTMRKNWSKNWLSEFRYGYESIGNHIIDVSIRLYDM